MKPGPGPAKVSVTHQRGMPSTRRGKIGYVESRGMNHWDWVHKRRREYMARIGSRRVKPREKRDFVGEVLRYRLFGHRGTLNQRFVHGGFLSSVSNIVGLSGQIHREKMVLGSLSQEEDPGWQRPRRPTKHDIRLQLYHSLADLSSWREWYDIVRGNEGNPLSHTAAFDRVVGEGLVDRLHTEAVDKWLELYDSPRLYDTGREKIRAREKYHELVGRQTKVENLEEYARLTVKSKQGLLTTEGLKSLDIARFKLGLSSKIGEERERERRERLRLRGLTP